MLSYEEERVLLARDRLRLLTLYGIPFCMAFSILDYLVVDEFFYEFAVYRVLAGLGAGILLAVAYTGWGAKNVDQLAIATMVSASFWLSVMCFRLGGFSATYYPALMLAQFFTLFAPLSVGNNVIAQALVILFYVVINAFRGDWHAAPEPIAFLSGSALTCAIQAYAVSITRKREYDLRLEVSEARRAQERIFSSVTHELRTPLSLILTPAQAELRDAQSEETKRRLGVIVRNGLRLLRLVNQLLELARLSADRLTNSPRATNVAALVGGLLEDVAPRATELGLNLTPVLPAETRIVQVDARHLETILVNLVGNAIKFTPRGGSVEVGLDYHDSEVKLWVKDDGPGIAEEVQRRVFERFSQAEEVAALDGGSGLGLAVVAELVQLIDAQIELESKDGAGACFKVSFPLVESDAIASPERSSGPMADLSRIASLEVSAATHCPTSVTHRCRRLNMAPHILVVEDNDELRTELVDILVEDFAVTEVSDGQVALSELAERDFALVCTDVQMPIIDGIELVRSIRSSSAFSDVPIVMLTAFAAIENRVTGLKLGVDSYVAKPPNAEELRAVITGLLRSRLTVFGDYLLHRQLGEGGFGSVYLATEMKSGQAVAVKLQNASDLLTSTAEAQLSRERNTLSTLEHPNIVRLHQHGSSDGTMFVAMEYLSGTNGEELLSEINRFSAGQVSLFAYQVSSALAELHRDALVHRDVKLPNVMITDDRGLLERCKLIDFGIAERLGDGRRALGTVTYIAPELLDGCSASPASDMFALGVAMHRAATGEFPFSGRTADEAISAIALGERTSTASRALPDTRVSQAIESCLHGEPDRRMTADELMSVFESAVLEDFQTSTGKPGTRNLSSLLSLR
ncbi:MAG: protein kinase [Myxococcota bacterium]